MLRPSSRPRAACLIVSLLAVPCAETLAASLAAFGFETGDGSFTTGPTFLADGVIAGEWQDVDGTLTGYAGSPGRALGARDFDDGNALRWSVRATAGRGLALTALRFDQLASTSGPKFWALEIDGTTVATGATSTVFTPVNVPLAFVPGEFFEISLAGFDAGSAVGTWRIDNFELLGEVQGDSSSGPGGTSPVPLPPALLPFAAALLLTAGARPGVARPQRQRHSRQPSSSGK